jgi:hypothetical protein
MFILFRGAWYFDKYATLYSILMNELSQTIGTDHYDIPHRKEGIVFSFLL